MKKIKPVRGETRHGENNEENNINFTVRNISEFKSLYNGSKIIFIEQHRLTEEQRLQQIQRKFARDGWRIGSCGVFKLFETEPKVQCSSVVFWNLGIAYCTCRRCLIYVREVWTSGRITQTIGFSIKNSKDLTLKQTFDITEKLASEQSDDLWSENN